MRIHHHGAVGTLVLALTVLALGACADGELTSPGAEPAPPSAATPLGVMEITLTGLDDSAPRASASPVSPGAPGSITGQPGPSYSLTPVGDNDAGEVGIELVPLATGSFTEGERGNGGVRYVHATFGVRNASTQGTPYSTARRNLTFMAVATAGTIGHTPVSTIRHFDGGPAAPEIAARLLPTGASHRRHDRVVSSTPDVLQVFTEAEAAAVLAAAPDGVTDVFPYGFVVDAPVVDGARTLQADPAEEHFEGVVTFAFKLPLQSSPAHDPFTVSVQMLAVEDDDTRITQSLEEQTPASQAAFEARATTLGASLVTLLPGGAYSGAGSSRMICSVRTAGSADAPAAYLVRAAGSLDALSPDPYGTAGSAISRSAQLTAHFDGPVASADAGSFIVRGLQSGVHFVGTGYDGIGTSSITTPAGSFFPGEEIEVVLTDALAACPGGGLPHVARLRAGVEPGAAGFTSITTLAPGSTPQTVALADLNGDGILDLVTMVEIVEFDPVFQVSSEIHVVINDGDLSNPTVHTLSDPRFVKHIAIGDLTGDGIPDLAVATDGPHLLLFPGIGDGTFDDHTILNIGGRTTHIALGDVNADGHLDLVVAVSSIDQVVVLLGNGDGTFAAADYYPTGMNPTSVVLADFNEDGALDIAVASRSTHRIAVRLGDGRGGFGAETTYDAGREPSGLIAADLNGDGKVDLAVANDNTTPSNQNSSISILLGNGDGTFAGRSAFTVSSENGSGYLASGDLNGDGHIDLVSSFEWGRRVTVHLNDGTGSFTTGATPSADRPKNLALGDLNGDGRLDIVVPYGISSGGTRVIFNN